MKYEKEGKQNRVSRETQLNKKTKTTNRNQNHRKYVENEKLGKRKIWELKVPVKTQHERRKTRKGKSLNNSQNI